MRTILYKAVPWNKEDALLALESGVDGLICPDAEQALAATLARCPVFGESETALIALASKSDEEQAAKLAHAVAARNKPGKGAKPAHDAAPQAAEHGDSGPEATGKASGESPRAAKPAHGTPPQAAGHGDFGPETTGKASGESGKGAAPEASGKELKLVVLKRGWEIIPLENLLAGTPGVAVEAGGLEEAVLAAGVLERGADTIVLTHEALPQIKDIVFTLKYSAPKMDLAVAEITAVSPAGMGHRVCVDTSSLLCTGQGMLVGNSAAFTFLVNAETERNEYVAARPFRINAGGVHAYAQMPGDRTAYLEELAAGREVLIVGHDGATSVATVGRVKVERRPMLLVEARLKEPDNARGNAARGSDKNAPGSAPGSSTADGDKNTPGSSAADGNAARGSDKNIAVSGTVFLQNAETIRLVRPDGTPVSVVTLKPGDTVLCRADAAGRHFGMRIAEDIKEG